MTTTDEFDRYLGMPHVSPDVQDILATVRTAFAKNGGSYSKETTLHPCYKYIK